MMLPLTVISLLALLAASWLIPRGQACRMAPGAAAYSISPASHAARCHPAPAVKLDQVRMH
jgi:hypothetical protein